MSYNTCEAPILHNYGEAKDWFDKVKPIRGQNVKPLGYARRHWRMASISMDGDDVVLNYYNQPMVVWHPDDSLTIHQPRWCTAFEPDKLAHFIPPGLCWEWSKGRLVLFNSFDQTRLVIGTEPIHLACVGVVDNGRKILRKFQAKNIPQATQAYKRRGVAKKIMKDNLTPFLEWVQLTIDFSPIVQMEEHDIARNEFFHDVTGITRTEFDFVFAWDNATPYGRDEASDKRKQEFYRTSRVRNSFPMSKGMRHGREFYLHREGVRALYDMMLPENQDKWLSALRIIAGNCLTCITFWHPYNTGMSSMAGYPMGMATLTEYVEKIVCAVFRDEVFKVVPVEPGSIPSITYDRFFVDTQIGFFEKTDTVSDSSN